MPYGGTRTAWQYVSDDGTIYRVSLATYITSQNNGATPPVALIGGVAASPSNPPKPASLRMRYTTVRDTVNKVSRKLYVMEPTPDAAPILLQGTTINLNEGGTLKPFTSSGFWTNEVNGRRVQK